MAHETTQPSGQQQGTVRVRDISDVEAHVIVEDDVGVVVRDGTRLSTRVFRPAETGEYPVILALTAYGKDLGPDTYPAPARYAELPDFDNGIIEVSPWTTWEGPDPATWVPKGYVVVYLDVRGYHQSEGDASVLSPQDADDFYDVIEWAGAQKWSNGNVGTIGVSYLAISQWAAAGLNPPSLKAMVPWEGQTDSFREVLYHGGVPETTFTKFWLNRVNGLANTPPLPDHDLFQLIHRDPQAMAGIREQQFVRPELAEVPALVAATWSDQGLHTRGSFGGFVQTSATEKWLFTHGQPKWSTFYSDEAIEYQQAFFDHFLKGEDNGMDQRPAVRLEVRETRDERDVRFENEWPLARTEYHPLYLDAASGALVETQPVTASAKDYQPLTGSATFTTTFDEDTELTGHMKLRLWVSTTEGTDIDLFVGVNKLDVHGEEVHFYAKAGYLHGPVAMGWLRVSERALDEQRSTPWQPVLRHDHPQPLTPGEIVPVDVEILPSSTLFRAGESLEVVVQGADLFEHPALGHAYSRDVNQGTHTIHTGGDYGSHLLVPANLSLISMDPWQIAAVIAFTSAGATVHASVGIGIGLVAGPALIAVDPGFLPGPVIMATLLLTARHLIVDGHHADRGTVQRAYIGIPFGLALGFALVAAADEATMRTVIGCAIVIAAVLLLLGVHVTRSARTDVLGGGAYALSLIAAGIPGPAAAVAFNDLPPTRYRGTMGFMGIPVSIVSLALLALAGEFGSYELELTAWMIPGILVGLLAGRHVRPHLDNAWFRTAVLWLALLGGAAVVIRQVA